ncbi:hypothetical protein D3C76_1293580 [compost metagenome]
MYILSKLDDEWTIKQDKKLKRLQECLWDLPCILCSNFNRCEDDLPLNKSNKKERKEG